MMAVEQSSSSRVGSLIASVFHSARSLLGSSQAINSELGAPKLQNASISSISAELEADNDEYGPDLSQDPFETELDPFEDEDDPFMGNTHEKIFRHDPRRKGIAADTSLNSSRRKKQLSRLAYVF